MPMTPTKTGRRTHPGVPSVNEVLPTRRMMRLVPSNV